MFQLRFSTLVVLTPAGPVARLTDLTDWSQASSARGTWAIFLAAGRIGSIAAQDAELEPLSYEPRLFQSGANPAGTVDVPLPGDGAYRVRAVAVPTLLNAAAFAAATPGRLYYRLDSAAFVYKTLAGTGQPVSDWAAVRNAALTDNSLEGAETRNLLDRAAETYAYGSADCQAALAQLNLAYLEATPRARLLLLHEYVQAELLLNGGQRQFDAGFYADAATTLRATERLLGACLPGFYQSLPAIPVAC